MNWPSIKTYGYYLALLLVVESVSWLAYTGPRSEQMITIVVGIVLAIVAWRRPKWLALASIAEIIIGSKGYLLFYTIHGQHITLRMILFGLLCVVSIRPLWQQWLAARTTVVSRLYLGLLCWFVVAVAVALIRGVHIGAVYADANAFIFLLLLPIWWIQLRSWSTSRTHVIALLLAGATVIGMKTWLMVTLFGQNIASIRHVYEWIRNTGVGEITYINANMFRVFFQSQVYSLFVLCFVLVTYVNRQAPRWALWPLAWAAAGVYMSLSRSFWLGVAAALVVLVAWLMYRRLWTKLRRLWVVLPVSFFAWAMFVWGLSWPSFHLSGGRASAIVARLQGAGAAEASTSRTNQIKPLLTAIGHHPVIGSGFGTTVTYLSTDPRTPGWKTTAAFELGYLDLWLKLGLVGLGLYAAWVLQLWRRAVAKPYGGAMVIAGLALVVVNLTSPYLNHPLGLGWLMLTSLFAYARD